MNKCEEIHKKIWGRKKKDWIRASPDTCHIKYEQIYFKPIVTTAVKYWCQIKQTDQRKGTENPTGISSQWEKESAVQEVRLGFHKDYCLLSWFDLLKHWNFPYVKITTLPKCLQIKWWDVWDLLQNNRREVEGIKMKQNWLYFDNGWSWVMDMPRLITLFCLLLCTFENPPK